jgi:hypothetical protein
MWLVEERSRYQSGGQIAAISEEFASYNNKGYG